MAAPIREATKGKASNYASEAHGVYWHTWIIPLRAAVGGVDYVAGLSVVGNALGLVVAGLALLAATTGFCVGCEIYRVGARLRGIRRGAFDRFELADLGSGLPAGELMVAFSHPLCTDCRTVEAELAGTYIMPSFGRYEQCAELVRRIRARHPMAVVA